MQPAIPLGTLLQKRYRVTRVLGQGGFGRTYLAQDTACFDEPCVLKEFTPNDRGRDSLRKARELFQREAKALYQINHPQIPRFRANFEEAKRLFLVQEYAEGKTYAKLLGERIRESRTFTEEEALLFLQQMLPVLDNVHSQGIIHRDISPDNIILRESDQKPVLIDFGVVKAGVQNLEAEDTDMGQQGTTVGKAGYAPNEQLQTGEAYANSDLYALAVTVVVMMTGRKPESLIDKSTMTWKWQQWLPTISPWFAKVLMRMMSYRPTNRYQSAKEVLQALRSVADLVGSSSSTLDSGEPSMSMGSPTPSYSSSNSVGTVPQNRYTTYSPKQKPRNPILNSPWILAAAGGCLVLVPFWLFTYLLPKTSNTPKPNPTPIVTQSDGSQSTGQPSVPVQSATANPSSAAIETLPTETINVPTGQTFVREGSLRENQTMVYRVPGLIKGNQLTAKVDGGVQLTVLAPNSEPVNFQSKKVSQWQGDIPVSGDYLVELTLPSGGAASSYKLTLINVTPSPIVSPSSLVPVLPSSSPSNPLVSPTFTITPPPVTSPR
jgi:serine/threonine protein kinase